MDSEKILYWGIAAIVVVLAIPLIYPLLVDNTELDAARDQQRMERLGKAIETYAKINERYPSTLYDLVPEYIAEVPLTTARESFEYDPRTGWVSHPSPADPEDDDGKSRRRASGGGISPATDAMTGVGVSQELNY